MIVARRLAAVCAALALAACAVDARQDVAAYRDVLDAGLGQPADAPQPGGAMDVRAAMRLANARNEALCAEGEGYVRALLDRRRAAAAFLPRIAFGPSLFRNEFTATDVRQSGLDAPLAASLRTNPVSDDAEIRRADATSEERLARLLALQDSVLADAARTLLGVVLLERRVAVLRSSLTVQEARAEDARVRRDTGLARPLDAALAESRSAGTRVELVEAETAARRGRALLAFLTGAGVEDVRLDDALEVPDAPPALGTVTARAAQRRMEIAAGRSAVLAALAGVESAYGQWYPSVSANVTAFLRRDSSGTAPEWTSLLSVSIPLFTAGVVEADVRSALSRLREARDRLSLTERSVRREVEDAWTGFESARRRIDEVRVRLDASRRAVEQADGLWTAGLATNLERLTAQDEALSAELDLAGAEIARKSSYLDLQHAAGSLHELIGLDRTGVAAGEDQGARAR